MPNHARITVVGHLGRDPELRTAAGSSVCNFSVAVKTRTKEGGEWTDLTTWYNVTCWGRAAENAAQYLNKGDPVLVDGEHSLRVYQGRDGTDKCSCEISNATVTFLRVKNDDQQPAPKAKPKAVAVDPDDEPPF